MRPLPTPALVPAGHVVRVRLGGYCYTSAVMSATEAEAEAERIHKAAARDAGPHGFVDFTDAAGTKVRIKGRSISAIEHGRPHARKESTPTAVSAAQAVTA